MQDGSCKVLWRCSLRFIFVLTAILQVAIATVVMWLIGYESQLSLVSNLSASLRQQTLNHAIDQASQLLSYPFLWSTSWRRPPR